MIENWKEDVLKEKSLQEVYLANGGEQSSLRCFGIFLLNSDRAPEIVYLEYLSGVPNLPRSERNDGSRRGTAQNSRWSRINASLLRPSGFPTVTFMTLPGCA